MASLQSRIMTVDRFVQAKRLSAGGDVDQAIALCAEIAADPDAEQALRVGDVLALEFEGHLMRGDDVSARTCVERMIDAGIALLPFLEEASIRDLYARLGEPSPLDAEPEDAGDEGSIGSGGDEIDEDVAAADDDEEEIEDLGNDGF
jgi:hypothetical protein